MQFWKVIHFYSTVIYSNPTYLPLSSSSLRISNFFSQVSINPRYKWPFLQFLSTVATLSLLQVSVPLKRVWICYLWAEIVFKKKSCYEGKHPTQGPFPLSIPCLFDHLSLSSPLSPCFSLTISIVILYTLHQSSFRAKKKKKKKSTKPQQRLGFDFLHRSKPNGGVLFSCLKQSTLILLPWRALVEVRSFVPLPDQMPSYEVETCQPQALMYKQIS